MEKKRRPKTEPRDKGEKRKVRVEKPVPEEIYPVIDNDLARDNVENDLPDADLHDL